MHTTRSMYSKAGYILHCIRLDCLSFKLYIKVIRFCKSSMSTRNYFLLTQIASSTNCPPSLPDIIIQNELFNDSTQTYQGRALGSNTARLLCQSSSSQPAQTVHDDGHGNIKGSETKTIARSLSCDEHPHAPVPSKLD